ncbi:MAG: flavodoxin family protein [Candidatus Nanoarchaeia archaeon]|nr:flavodoxin family protein [Candidatus Nanoarchaeia archaeon]
MKALIICKSICHNNTIKVSEAISEVLNANIITPDKFSKEMLKKYSVIGFGSGIFYMKHHKELLELADSLPSDIKLKAFVFSTSGWAQKKPIDVHASLREKLKSKGFEIIGEFYCKGYDTWSPLKLVGGISKGHPDKKDLDHARKFAEKIKESF